MHVETAKQSTYRKCDNFRTHGSIFYYNFVFLQLLFYAKIFAFICLNQSMIEYMYISDES